MKRCATCKYFQPIDEVCGYCEVRNLIVDINGKCLNWEEYK